MRKLISIGLLFFFAHITVAQNFLPEYVAYDTLQKMTIRTAAHFNYQTSAVPNYFSSYFLNGGKITQTDKDDVSGRLKKSNSVGAEEAFSIRFTDFSSHPFKDSTLGYYFNIEHQDHIGMNFSKNLFDLVFNGNGPYTGQNLDLTKANFSRTTFQKFGFGLTDMNSGSWFGVSVVKGQSFSFIDFSRANFLTDDSTANISFDYAANISRSDTNKTNWGSFNGLGLSIDFAWNFKVGRDSILPDLLNFQLRVQNAGFISWNTATLNYAADTTVHYNGFSVNNILKPEEGLITGSTSVKDSLNINYVKKKYTALLPADFLLGNYINPLKGYWLKPLYGMRYKLMDGYTPMPYLGACMRVARRTHVQLSGSYGGWGGFRMGLRFETQFGKHIHFIIGSSHMDGLYSRNAYGKDGYVALWVRF